MSVSRDPIHSFDARVAVLPVDNVDTDQIIPARFLKGTTRTGLAQALFADWRRREDFPLHHPAAAGAAVLVTGANFGCGSSREHAVWSLMAAGFRAVIAGSFADIFRSNALKNGLLPIVVAPEAHQRLLATPGTAITIDLAAQQVRMPGGTAERFSIEPFARYRLLQGLDELDLLLAHQSDVATYEQSREDARL